MPKFDIGFIYTSEGTVTVEADTLADAEEAARKRLGTEGPMPEGDDIVWSNDEIEVI